MVQEPGITDKDRLLAVTTLSFDISVLELFGPLVAGATVVIADPATSADGYALAKLISDEQISIMQATPVTWRLLLNTEWQGNSNLTALCGGEALDLALAHQLAPICKQLWNMYGPTETTIWSTCERINTEMQRISVGRPIANTSCYILDPQDIPVPAGVAGELCIGGDGVAQGYLKRAELTAEKFVADPFRNGERMYRTGDLARFLPDGRIDIIGRTDFQVKLRGFRIELGEIETLLGKLDSIDQAVVIVREDTPGDQRLVAYLRTNTEISANELHEQLSTDLPAYMIPAAFTVLDEMPLTSNGKVNRKALPAPIWDSEQEFVAAETATELAVTDIWQDVLRMEKIGTQDNFFVLGGHSLLATQLIVRIRRDLNVEIPLAYIFDFPSIYMLSTAIDAFKVATSSAPIMDDDEDIEDISI